MAEVNRKLEYIRLSSSGFPELGDMPDGSTAAAGNIPDGSTLHFIDTGNWYVFLDGMWEEVLSTTMPE